MSVIGTVKAKVYDLHESQMSEAVTWGLNERDKEFVSIWQGESTSDAVVLGGSPPPLDEEFTITLVTQALAFAGRDMKQAEIRAWEIHNAAEAILRADLHLGGISFFTTPAKARQEFVQTDQQQGTRITMTFTGKTRI